MSLYDRLESDVKAALKQGDSLRVSVLRMLIAAIKMAEIQGNVKRLDENGVISTVQKHIKQHKESIEQFEKGNRNDLAEKERNELKILEGYMPEQLGEEELLAIVKAAISETGAATKADMGKVMRAVMEKAKGRADGKAINQIVAKLLK